MTKSPRDRWIGAAPAPAGRLQSGPGAADQSGVALFKSLRERLAEDLPDIIELPLQCAVNLTYFLEERAWRLRRRFLSS